MTLDHLEPTLKGRWTSGQPYFVFGSVVMVLEPIDAKNNRIFRQDYYLVSYVLKMIMKLDYYIHTMSYLSYVVNAPISNGDSMEM